jgi:pyruvate formate lyase activating enzyme
MTFNGFIPMDLVNWPGRMAATVFTSGCNFRCPYCHNADLVTGKESKTYTEEEILDFLKKRPAVDSLVISGGEPTIHKDLPDFIRKVKKLGRSVKLDTNGTDPDMIEELVYGRWVDYIAMDLKAPWYKYHLIGNETLLGKVKRSLWILRHSCNENNVLTELRTTCPKDMLTKRDIIEIVGIADGMELTLQMFDPEITLDPLWHEAEPWTKEELEDLTRPFPNVYVR